MHRIKKYANRKLYDTKTKCSITMDDITDLIKAGEEIIVIDNQTGEDITSSILSSLVSRNLSDQGKDVPKEFLTDLLRKGGEGLLGPARTYFGFWQRAVAKAEDKIDKIEGFIGKKQKVADLDDYQVKDETLRNENEAMKWITNQIDEGIERSLKKKNFATKKQIYNLKTEIQKLSVKIDLLQGIFADLLGNNKKTP